MRAQCKCRVLGAGLGRGLVRGWRLLLGADLMFPGLELLDARVGPYLMLLTDPMWAFLFSDVCRCRERFRRLR